MPSDRTARSAGARAPSRATARLRSPLRTRRIRPKIGARGRGSGPGAAGRVWGGRGGSLTLALELDLPLVLLLAEAKGHGCVDPGSHSPLPSGEIWALSVPRWASSSSGAALPPTSTTATIRSVSGLTALTPRAAVNRCAAPVHVRPLCNHYNASEKPPNPSTFSSGEALSSG